MERLEIKLLELSSYFFDKLDIIKKETLQMNAADRGG